MPNIFVQPIARDKCPRCGASSRPRSAQFKPFTAPASFGVYFRGNWNTLFHACVHCFETAHKYVGNEPLEFKARAGYSLPAWLRMQYASN